MADKKILIIEDDPKSMKLMREILKHEKYEIYAATDGYQALAMALDRRPDLILLDINLPCGDGISVHERITINCNLCAMSVIYITADPSAKVRAMGKKLGAVTVLSKPIDRAQLLRAISWVFHGNGAKPITALAQTPQRALLEELR
jgi:DNA-binding response OmpR family regulator